MALTLISTSTASASATLDITSGIDGTYDSYEFHCVNMHPASDNQNFGFQVNAAGQTGFNEVMTTTAFWAYHNETDTLTALSYGTGEDLGQATTYQPLFTFNAGNDADQSVSGILTLYDPASTTFVKHFTAEGAGSQYTNFVVSMYNGGYINTTTAIDEISFKFASGNIDSGVIKMFGVS